MRWCWVLALLLPLLGGCDACARQGPVGHEHSGSSSEQPGVAPQSASAAAASSPSGAGPRSLAAQEHTWVYPESPAGPMHVVVSVPERSAASARLPVLVALHGRGEALKGPARGARGWVDDYWMPRAISRLHHPPLTSSDLLGMADAARLTRINESLTRAPYRGLIVVCPYTPDIWAGNQPLSRAEPLTRFVVEELLPRVYREVAAVGTPESTGIDGVSLGGRAALLVGLNRPEAFGAVAALQPAFSSADAPALAQLAKRARERNPKLRIRLLTSLEDFYLVSTRHISRALTEAAVPNQLDVVPGTHDYDFNRGPGVYEMLLFHDRALRGEQPL
jgi:enterochelin esterase-like enzyme